MNGPPPKPKAMLRATVRATDSDKPAPIVVNGHPEQRIDDPIPTSVTTLTSVSSVTSVTPLDEARAWFARFIYPLSPLDLDLLALWSAHTHYLPHIGTTPRLLVESPMPASGKTTVIEHLARLTFEAVQMGSLSSPAMLSRLLASGDHTLLIDEIDRNLRPEREGVAELLAVLNSGYKRGASRPVTVPDGGNGWKVEELPTYAPVAMAGIDPHLPDDTLSRTLRVTILPDVNGEADDSDWEEIEPEAEAVAESLADWAAVTPLPKPPLPEGVRGRSKERWRPLWRVAAAAGGAWPDKCRDLIEREAHALQHDSDLGLTGRPPAVALLADVVAEWPLDLPHWKTPAMVAALSSRHPERWGATSTFPRGLTVQRVGRYLSRSFHLRTHMNPEGARVGYRRSEVFEAASRLGIIPPSLTEETAGTDVTEVPARATPSRHTPETSPPEPGETPESQRKPNPRK